MVVVKDKVNPAMPLRASFASPVLRQHMGVPAGGVRRDGREQVLRRPARV